MDYLPTSEADLLYQESKKTIQRKLKEVAQSLNHPRRNHLLPSYEEYVAIKQTKRQPRFLATMELLDSLGLNRKEGSRRSTETETIGRLKEDAERQAIDVIEDSPYVKLLKQQLSTREAENEKLLGTLHEMTVNRRVENMIRAKEMGLPIPKVDKDGQIVIGDSENVGRESVGGDSVRTKGKPTVVRRSMFGRFFGSKTMTGSLRHD